VQVCDLALDRGNLLIGFAYVVRDGQRIRKDTQTHQERFNANDPETCAYSRASGLLYLIFVWLCGWLVLLSRSSASKMQFQSSANRFDRKLKIRRVTSVAPGSSAGNMRW
jgi:hypothetical protein